MLANRIQGSTGTRFRVRQHGPSVPPGELAAGPFTVRFASVSSDHDKVQLLRVEGCAQGCDTTPASAGLDVFDDAIRDSFVHHLLVCGTDRDEPTGTARITAGADLHELVRSRASHFDLEALPTSLIDRSAWIDRLAIAPEQLQAGVLWRLLSGLHRYLDWNDLRYLLCPAMVASDDPGVVAAASLELARSGGMSQRYSAPSLPDYAPEWSSPPAPSREVRFSPWLTLLSMLGARVCGGPAVDSARGVTMFLMRVDLRELAPQVRGALPGPGCWVPRPRNDP